MAGYAYEGGKQGYVYAKDGVAKGYVYAKDGVGKGYEYGKGGISYIAQSDTAKAGYGAAKAAGGYLLGAMSWMLSSDKKKEGEGEGDGDGEGQEMKEETKEDAKE